MYTFELYATQINHTQAAAIGPYLVERGQWFSLEPLPDDVYELQVKAEHQQIVTAFLA